MTGHQAFSAMLASHIDRVKGKTVSLDDLRDMLHGRVFGVMLFLVALVSLVPLPGAGTILGILPMLIGIQMVIGLQRPWLPKRVLGYRMDKAKVVQGLVFLNEYIGPFERFAKPRWEWMFNPIMDRVNGLVIIVAAVPIMIPAPLSNLPPALALMILGIALVEEDGVLVIVSWAIIAFAYLLLLGLYGTLLFGMIFGALKVVG